MKLLVLVLLFPLMLAGQCRSGADLSYVNTIEDNGGLYRDANGTSVDPYRYFAERGAEIIRIRLWHTPRNVMSSCGTPITANATDDMLRAARRIDSAGMQMNLAIHYSDYFADPGKQKRPAAWDGLEGQTLLDSIYNYTYRVLEALHRQGTDPAIVAIGNETTNGFVDATARTDGFDWAEDADKFKAGLRAVTDFNAANATRIERAVHFTERTANFLAGEFASNGITDYDILGLSYYPNFSPDLSVAAFGQLVNQLVTTTEKEVMVFETGFIWTANGFADNYGNFLGNNGNVVNFPTTPAGQRDFLLALSEAVIDNGGSGLTYWEPAWISSGMCDAFGQGSSYENASFFDFENGNRPLPAFDFLAYCGTVSTADSSQDQLIEVYPNPVSGRLLTVISTYPLKGWVLSDASGRAVDRGSWSNETEYRLDLGGYRRGIYFLRLSLADGNSVVRRIVRW